MNGGQAPERLRVLHVLEATLGGTRRYLQDIIVCNSGDEMGLVYSLDRADQAFEGTLESAVDAGWQTWNVPMRRSVSVMGDLRATKQVRGIISRWQPDLVHCHSSKAGAVGRIAARLLRKAPRVIYSPHAISARVHPAYALIERLLAPLATRYIAVSESEREELVGLRLAPPDRVDVVCPLIDLPQSIDHDREGARARLRLGSGPLLIGVGRLTHQKNPQDFLRIALMVRQHVPNVHALWVGDGDLRGQFDSMIAANSASEWVSVTGWLKDVRDYFVAADVILSTARYESYGYVVPEALAIGRPVVAAKATGIVDIMTGPLAQYLFLPNELESAAVQVCRLLDEPIEVSRIVNAGRDIIAERFTADRMRAALNASYRAATGARV